MCDAIDKALSAGVISRRSLLKAAAAGAALTASDPLMSSAVARPSKAARPSKVDARRYGTRLILLGTAGGPRWSPGSDRDGTASAVVVGGRCYVVDAGEGVGRRLQQAGVANAAGSGVLGAMQAIFLTHLHSDHVVDLNNLLSFGLYEGLSAAQPKVQVWGPGNRGVLPALFGTAPAPPVVAPDNPTPGTVEMVDLLVRAFAPDFNDRARDNREPVPEQLFDVHDVPIPAEFTGDPNGDPAPRMSPVRFFEDERVRVSATLVQHGQVFPAFAFRFDTDDGSVAFSGDTGPIANLIELAAGADVLVHEVIAREWVEQLLPEPRTEPQEALYQHLVTAHTTIQQVGPIAEQAGVRTLVLNHLVPGNWPEHKWRELVAASAVA